MGGGFRGRTGGGRARSQARLREVEKRGRIFRQVRREEAREEGGLARSLACQSPGVGVRARVQRSFSVRSMAGDAVRATSRRRSGRSGWRDSPWRPAARPDMNLTLPGGRNDGASMAPVSGRCAVRSNSIKVERARWGEARRCEETSRPRTSLQKSANCRRAGGDGRGCSSTRRFPRREAASCSAPSPERRIRTALMKRALGTFTRAFHDLTRCTRGCSRTPRRPGGAGTIDHARARAREIRVLGTSTSVMRQFRRVMRLLMEKRERAALRERSSPESIYHFAINIYSWPYPPTRQLANAGERGRNIAAKM